MLDFKKYLPLLCQMFLYGIIGLLSSGLDTLIFYLLNGRIDLNMYVANLISINCGIALSFVLNSRFNFKKTDQIAKRAFMFFIVGWCGLALSMLILYLGVQMIGVKEIWVKIASVFIVAEFQFVLNKLITFRTFKSNENKEVQK